MVPGQIFYYVGPHLGPRKYRMELFFMSETFSHMDLFIAHSNQ